MGIFDDIGKEIDKAMNPKSATIPSYISKIKPIKTEYDETVYYINQLEKKKQDNAIDEETYQSLSLEYRQKQSSLLSKLDQYYEKFTTDKTESESTIKRSSFEKGEINNQLAKNTEEFSNDIISDAEYRKKKIELEQKSKKVDIQLEKAKKTLKQIDGLSELFSDYKTIHK